MHHRPHPHDSTVPVSSPVAVPVGEGTLTTAELDDELAVAVLATEAGLIGPVEIVASRGGVDNSSQVLCISLRISLTALPRKNVKHS